MNVITPVQKQLTLIRREFWEQRIPFLLVPVCSVIFIVVAFGFSTVRAYIKDYSPIVLLKSNAQSSASEVAEALTRFADGPVSVRENVWGQFYLAPVVLLFFGFWSIMLYYYLMTLYQSRKDRSILFWNSMPISSTQTILSKLVAGLVFTQGIFLVCVLCIQLGMAIVLAIYGVFFDVDIWNTFIAPAHLFSNFFWLVLFGVINIIWCLPVYGWLLFWSAWAKSAPLAWAGGPLVILIVPELLIYQKSDVLIKLMDHLFPTWIIDFIQGGAFDILNFVLKPEMLVSAILGIGLVYAAIRFNRSEDI